MQRSNVSHALTRLFKLLIAGALGMALTSSAVIASAQPKPTDWAASDVKGRSVDVAKYRGKVLLVFITSDKTKDLMRPITEELILKYGHNPKVAQVTLADFSDAPFAWKAAESTASTVSNRTAGAHDRTVKRIQSLLKENNKPQIPGLSSKLHIVIDWEKTLVAKYKHWDTSKFITIVVLNQQGDAIGAWKAGPNAATLTNQLDTVFEAIDATLTQ